MAHILILKRAHFFSIDNDLIDVHAKTIGATALAVYTALARFVNRKTGECWPSIARLAHLLDLARNTVKTALRKLEAAGLIAIRRRRDPAGDATSHLYTLLDASPHAVEARLARRAADELSAEGFQIVMAKFWWLRFFEQHRCLEAFSMFSDTVASNELMRQCFMRRQFERHFPGVWQLFKPLPKCRTKRRFLRHPSTHCGTRCNSLASKIVRLLSESLSAIPATSVTILAIMVLVVLKE